MNRLFYLLLGIYLSYSTQSFSQIKGEVSTAIDTTSVRIGEQINVTIQVKTTDTAMVEFPPEAQFLPFEILEESPLDTFKSKQHYLYTKRYALIQFDSGKYWIPRQKIVVDGFSKFSDSIGIEVATVKVDTLQQPLYDIKPIQLVARSYTALIQRLSIGFAFVLLLIVLYYLSQEYQKKREALRKEIPPFDKAINELKALDQQLPKEQEEFKRYYSKLTGIIRSYLEEEASIDALESTSDELLDKLELRKDAGTLALSLETLNNLKNVLKNADLVKFARSAPAIGVATNDRTLVEKVVIETKEALPAPTEEELAATAEFQRIQARKKRKQKAQLIAISAASIVVMFALGSIAIYGFTPVKDTLFRYPTKVLLDGTWVKSEYGTPPIQINTPQVLIRAQESTAQKTIYSAGSPVTDYYTELSFSKRSPSEKKELSEEEKEQEARELMDATIAGYEEKGAVNLLVQNDTFTTKDGTEIIRLFGSLDFPTGENNIRCRFVSIVFPFEKVTVELKLVHPKDDRYGLSIEEQILESIEIIKEL